jgi:hypothetical protein
MVRRGERRVGGNGRLRWSESASLSARVSGRGTQARVLFSFLLQC